MYKYKYINFKYHEIHNDFLQWQYFLEIREKIVGVSYIRMKICNILVNSDSKFCKAFIF